jgi:hypothetical protein
MGGAFDMTGATGTMGHTQQEVSPVKNVAFLALLVIGVYLVSGCSGDKGGGISYPRVASTSPENGATGVPLSGTIRVTFSQNMDEASVDSIYISDMTVHHVDYDDTQKTATVYIDSLLKASTAYTVTVSSYCMTTGGTGLEDDYEFSFTTGPLNCTSMEDYFEPNDDIASATPVTFFTEYPVLTSCGGPERKDFFKFTLTERKKVTANAEVFFSDTWPIQYLFAFYDEDGHEYTSAGTSRSQPGLYSWRYAFNPGTYYVEIGNYRVDEGISAYTLTFVTSEACQDDPYEDNDFYDQAVAVTPDILLEDLIGCAYDGDYFAVDLTAGQTLTVTLAQDTPSSINRLLQIWESPTQAVKEYRGSASPAVVAHTATEALTYVVRVHWWTDNIVYSLNLEVTGP